MNYKLIMLPNPILVSDENPTKWYLDDTYTIRISFTDDEHYWSKRPEYKKIIAGIESLPKLDLSAIAERIGWVDLNKIESDYFDEVTKGWDEDSIEHYGHEVRQDAEIYLRGFKAAQSLNEKKYSEEDVILLCAELIAKYKSGKVKDESDVNKIVKSYSTPKEYNVEVEMERTRYPKGDDGWEDVYTPKITNNTIKVTKILS